MSSDHIESTAVPVEPMMFGNILTIESGASTTILDKGSPTSISSFHSSNTPPSTLPTPKSNGTGDRKHLFPESTNTWITNNNLLIYKPLYNLTTQRKELQRLGMMVTTKSATIQKDESNLLGISIGGGAPFCPCLYIVQVFEGTPAGLNGNLESGDELLAINNVGVKGKTKVQVAKMIQAATGKVTLHFNKLHADPERGKSLDIILKKLKHRLVDNMSSNTADNFGFSRAILCNDSLVKKLDELDGTEIMYKGLVEHAGRVLKAYHAVLQSYRDFGDSFLEISTREPQQRASEAFRLFGEYHRNLEKDGVQILSQMKPIMEDLTTYLTKAIPDTKLTINRYMDAKFTYLSYCLKLKEMDDEEQNFANLQETLYRVETGNYEYRLILRCRQEARYKFAKLRIDVLEKIELLECKHANDLATQLDTFLITLKALNQSVLDRLGDLPLLFPIEVDYKESDFQYKSQTLDAETLEDDEEDMVNNENNSTKINTRSNSLNNIAFAVEAIEEENPATIISVSATSNSGHEELLRKGLNLMRLNTDIPIPRPENEKSTSSDGHQSPKMSTKQNDLDLYLNDNALPINHVKSGSTPTENDAMFNNAHETDLILE